MSAVLDPLAAFRLDGRVAIVTGASGGLGARFARVLDAAGARVVVTARRVDRLEDLAAELTEGLPVACDVARSADLDALVDATLERYGRVDVVVNNAGIRNVAPPLDESDEAFEDVLRVNLTACFGLARRAATAMIERGEGGSIINISSIFGLVATGQLPLASYVASKGGLNHLTRELAGHWARHGIRVNALCPGFYASEMTTDTLEDERMVRWIHRRTPMGRVGEPHELDGALLYLASPASTYTTGQSLGVDGGMSTL